MATHDFEPEIFHVSLGSHEPVLRIASVGPTAVHVGDYLAIHLTADSPPGRPDSLGDRSRVTTRSASSADASGP